MNILEYPRLIRPLISVFLCIASIFLSLAGRPAIPHGRELDMSKFELTWSDEFDGDKLDLTKWDGHYYSDGDTIIRRGSYWNNSLATVSDGSLHIDKILPRRAERQRQARLVHERDRHEPQL